MMTDDDDDDDDCRNKVRAYNSHNLHLRTAHYFLSHAHGNKRVRSVRHMLGLCNNTPRAV